MLKLALIFFMVLEFCIADDAWKINPVLNLGCKTSKLKIIEYQLTNGNSTYNALFSLSNKFKVPSILVVKGKNPYHVNCDDVINGRWTLNTLNLTKDLESYFSFGFINIIEKNKTMEKIYPFYDFNYDNVQLECSVDDVVTSCIYKIQDFHKELKGPMEILILFSVKKTTNCEIPIVSLNPGNNFVVSIAYLNFTSTLDKSKFGVQFTYGSLYMPNEGFREHQTQLYNDEYNPGSFTSYIYSNSKDQFLFFPNITYYSEVPTMQKSSIIILGKQQTLKEIDIDHIINSVGLSIINDFRNFRKVDMIFGGEDANPYSDFGLAAVTFKFGEGKYDKTTFSVGTGIWLILVMGFLGFFILAGPALLIYRKVKKSRQNDDESEQDLLDDQVVDVE